MCIIKNETSNVPTVTNALIQYLLSPSSLLNLVHLIKWRIVHQLTLIYSSLTVIGQRKVNACNLTNNFIDNILDEWNADENEKLYYKGSKVIAI